MNTFEIIILGFVQGVTEWLPISSSGHLVLFEHWLDLIVNVEFNIFLHLASLLVVIIFFRKEVWEILRLTFLPKVGQENPRKKWGWYILLSTVITALIGWLFYPYIANFNTLPAVAGWLLVTSFLLVASFFRKENKYIYWLPAVVLGIAQGLAVLPGLSRSGAVIAIALILGLKKKDAFDYTFLLAIPAIAGSFLLSINNFSWQPIYLLGFAVTAIVGYLTLILLKQIVAKNIFPWFFIYTLILGLIIILLA